MRPRFKWGRKLRIALKVFKAINDLAKIIGAFTKIYKATAIAKCIIVVIMSKHCFSDHGTILKALSLLMA